MELVIAMAMITIIFAAVLPQFALIQSSWDIKQGTAEALQNGRVLMDHISRNLSKAKQITAVGADASSIDFNDCNGVTWRYDIGANSYVEFGPQPGTLSPLAGPVSLLRFTCYDAYDLNIPITDVSRIRVVDVNATIINSGSLGRDQTFTAWAYLRTNGSSQTALTRGTTFEFDTSNGLYPALSQIDSTHYLCAYTGPGSDGFAIVLTVNPGTWAVTKATLTALEFDTADGTYPALAQIDSTHYLCAYTGTGNDGFAIVLTVDPGTWAVTKATPLPLEYDASNGQYPALSQIDSTHYLCAYTGSGSDGFAIVLTVNLGTWAVTKATPLPFEYDTSNGLYPALSQIHSSGFLCSYRGPSNRAWAVVLNVDSAGWTISAETPLEFDSASAWPALAQIDAGNYLCAYAGQGSDGWAALFCTLRP